MRCVSKISFVLFVHDVTLQSTYARSHTISVKYDGQRGGGGVYDPWLIGRSVFIDDRRHCPEIKGEAFKGLLSHIFILENHV